MATYLNLLSASSFLLVSVPGSCSWRLRFQKDDRVLSVEKRNHIELKILELAKKLKISRPVELIEIRGLMGGAQAQGNEIFSGRIGIAINPELCDEMPEEELEFFLAHELSHIKANDLVSVGIASGIVGMITTLAMCKIFPSSATYFSKLVMVTTKVTSPAAAVGIVASQIAFAFFSKYREECADKLGLSICSNDAQKKAYKFFENIQIDQITFRNNEEGSSYLSILLKRLLITKEGEFRFDVFHPSLKNRINYLRPKLEIGI